MADPHATPTHWVYRITCERLDVLTIEVCHEDGRPLDWLAFWSALAAHDHHRAELTETLAALPFEAYRWESPGVSGDQLRTPVRFAVTDAPELHRPGDGAAFAEHLQVPHDELIVQFANLGGDAQLIVPTPQTGIAPDCYAHLAAFLRGAPGAQQHALWCAVARRMTSLSTGGHWLSTAGDGVPWLHVRLDQRPKYYRYRPFTVIQGA